MFFVEVVAPLFGRFLTAFSEVGVAARRPSWWRKMFVGSDEL